MLRKRDLAAHLKAYRSKIREAQDQDLVNKPQAKRLLSGSENLDAAILKVRAALAKNRIKVEYGILSYPTHLRIGEAYLAALAGAVRSQDYKEALRNKHDQELFRNLVRNVYSPQKGDEN